MLSFIFRPYAPAYNRRHGIDAYASVLTIFAGYPRRQSRAARAAAGTPFRQTSENLGEMSLYDHWLRSLGAAVITGPQRLRRPIPDAGGYVPAPAAGPVRRRAVPHGILCDGMVVSCDRMSWACIP